MPSFEKRVQPNGKLLIRVLVGYNGTKPIRKSKTFPPDTPTTEIERWAEEVRSETGGDTPQPKTPDAIIDAWLAHRERSVSNRTYWGYAEFTRLYLEGRLREFSKHSIEELLFNLKRQDGKPLAPKTLEKVRVILKMILEFAVEEGFIQHAPRLPKGIGSSRQKGIRVLTIEQSDTLREALQAAGEIELETMLVTGLRVSELLALEPKHVVRNTLQVEQSLVSRWGYREVGPPKSGHSYRTIEIPNDLAQRLRALPPTPTGFLFSLGQTGMLKRLKKHCRELGLPPVSLHQLRHSHCTYLLGKGVQVVAVSKRLGHHSVGFTLNTYSHLIPSMDRALLAALE